MSEKKYVGSGKKSQYGVNLQINLNRVLSELYNETKDVHFANALKLIQDGITAKRPPFIYTWTNKENKLQVELKVQTGERREPDKAGNDLTVSLNEFTPQPKQQTTTKTEALIEQAKHEDDLPF